MMNKILFPETINLCLYKRNYVLRKGLSFSQYIKVLDESNFSPFTLLIEKVSETKSVHVEIVLTNIMALWPWGGSGVVGEVLFSKVVITYLGERDFTLQASVGMGNLLMLSFYIALLVPLHN